ncbi:hypothetical protein CH305_18640 [Rhodococcus sp. 15-649-2-2]|uniref:hypothetical protein n=1 Tax=Rhodococcus sp. 15-649-2-2 TaxID=2023140 RepID=UPI000B9C0033|nr:hypothetical protein [Rhodococcus sp. 15-649-2-2]OZE77255.1 hypothetical protein CH305_18640 [Rhodococcus sp. 15-649-2-2]
MKRTLIVAAGALLMAGCSSSEPEIPTVTGPDASIVATVDCGDDGVAGVSASYGTGGVKETLIGRNPTTQLAGGQESFSSTYGTREGMDDATLSVTTSPTRGTCTTTLTDYDSGEVLVQKETSGKATVEAVISAG